MHALAALLTLAASACAYQVTQPSGSQPWSVVGAQPVAWSRVSTDPANFTIVLTRDSNGYRQVLVAQQDGGDSSGQTQVNPPSGGWVAGTGYRLNFERSADGSSGILAQSSQFDIKSPTSSSSVLTAPRPTDTVIPPGPAVTDTSPPAGSSTAGNGGAATITASTSLVALFGTVAYLIM